MYWIVNPERHRTWIIVKKANNRFIQIFCGIWCGSDDNVNIWYRDKTRNLFQIDDFYCTERSVISHHYHHDHMISIMAKKYCYVVVSCCRWWCWHQDDKRAIQWWANNENGRVIVITTNKLYFEKRTTKKDRDDIQYCWGGCCMVSQ